MGYGVDNSDKGAGKATTYSLKYLLLNTFLTPSIDEIKKTALPNLLKQTDQWINVLSGIHGGKVKSLDTVLEIYKVSSAIQKELETLIKNASSDQKNIDGKLPELSNQQFELTKKQNKVQILEILANYRMDEGQRTALEKLTKSS